MRFSFVIGIQERFIEKLSTLSLFQEPSPEDDFPNNVPDEELEQIQAANIMLKCFCHFLREHRVELITGKDYQPFPSLYRALNKQHILAINYVRHPRCLPLLFLMYWIELLRKENQLLVYGEADYKRTVA